MGKRHGTGFRLGWSAVGSLACLLVCAIVPPAPAQEASPASAGKSFPDFVPSVAVQGGDHPGFGRLVLDIDPGNRQLVRREGNIVLVTLDSLEPIGSLMRLPRNVLAVGGGLGQAEIIIAPGTTIRTGRDGKRLVIDVLDPVVRIAGASDRPLTNRFATNPPVAVPPVAIPPGPNARNPLPVPPIPPPPPHSPSGAPAAVTPGPVGASPTWVGASPVWDAAAQVMPPPGGSSAHVVSAVMMLAPGEPAVLTPPRPSPGQEPVARGGIASIDVPVASIPVVPGPDFVRAGPLALTVRLGVMPPGVRGVSFTVPFERVVGAAAFRRGGTGYVVFDQRRPLDLAALRGHPVFGGASVQLLATGTLLRLPLAPGTELALTREPRGWTVAALPAAAVAEPIRAKPHEAQLLLTAANAAAVIPVTDPETGAALLVGTQRRHGQAVLVARRWPGFTLQRSWTGVVIEPLADTLVLRTVADGFMLSGGPEGLALGGETDTTELMANADAMTRRFAFFQQPRPELQRLMQEQAVLAAVAPPLGRGPKRRELAQTMIALGLAAEAQAVLLAAAADDPREADSPDHIGLAAIAALLAGRVDEAATLNDARLDGSDEIRFWRATRSAMRHEGRQEDAPAAAADFMATLPLVLSYPEALRERLLPLVAETLVLGGETELATKLLAQVRDLPALGFARALLLQAIGKPDKALTALDALAAAPDRLVGARAGARAVELRLALGQLAPGSAAEALERLLFSWRGDVRELALRLRVAELHVSAGAWRPALALLHETEMVFPDDKPAIHARLRESFLQFLQDPAMDQMTPLDLVALVDENADLLSGGEVDAELAARLADRLADRLLALDLPRRAGPLLQKLAAGAPVGRIRARFGARLTKLRLQEGDAAGALIALADSAAEGLPAPLAEERSILGARAEARNGDTAAALAQLGDLTSEPVLSVRAAILEDAKHWPQAALVLTELASRTVPAEGTLDEQQQRTLLRLATALAQAGDAAPLARLREQQAARMPTGPVGDLFRLLTADSVHGVSDLPRTGREIALARSLSADPIRH